MAIIWIFLGSGVLVLLQRWMFGRFWSKGLRLRLRFEQARAAAGEDVYLEELVENRKCLPLPVVSFRYSLCRNFELMPKNGRFTGTQSYRLALPARKQVRSRVLLPRLPRGVYTVTQAELQSRDLFGTRKDSRPVSSSAMLTVFPASLPFEQISVPFRQLLGAVITRRSTLEDPFEFRGIRPYEVYDSMRTINWKASAKTGEWKVNQYQYTTDESVLLLLDLEHGTEEEREALISLTSSLSRLLLGSGVTVALRSNCRGCITGQPLRVLPGGGSGQQNAIDESLAQIKLGATAVRGFAQWLDRLDRAVLDQSLPVVLSVTADGPTVSAYERLLGREQGFFLTAVPGRYTGRRITFLAWQGRKGGKSA